MKTLSRGLALAAAFLAAAFLAPALLDAVFPAGPFSAGPFSVGPFSTGTAHAFELEPGVNTAGVIEYPTANDQFLRHTIAGTIELIDIGKPELALENVRYGLQLGALQLLGDVFFLTEPDWKFDQGTFRAKLRILQFDAERTSIAVGGLARFSDGTEEGDARIDDRPYSLLGVVTTELFPFQEWGGFLINAYVDNRVLDGGLKVQIYRFIKAVFEVDYFHSSPDLDDKVQTKGGIEIEGETQFYIQAFYSERFDHLMVQIGVGF